MSDTDDTKRNSIHIEGKENIIGAISQGDRTHVEATVNASHIDADSDAAQLFMFFQQQIDDIQDTVERQMAQIAVDGLKGELEKADKADPSILEKRLSALRKILPDAFDVAAATLTNPVKGFALVAQKVAAKMREELKDTP